MIGEIFFSDMFSKQVDMGLTIERHPQEFILTDPHLAFGKKTGT